MKKLGVLLLAVVGVFALSACNNVDIDDLDSIVDGIDYTDTSEDLTDAEIDQEIDDALTEIDADGINLEKDYEEYSSSEYVVYDDNGSITAGGVYYLSGTFGQITIDTTEDVTLLLDNANISSYDGPAVNILDAEDVTISSLEGTENYISDTFLYSNIDYNAAIYSKSDLVFNGTGTLTVEGNYNNAINCKDDIKIVETTLIVYSVDDGIIGKDYVAFSGADVTVDCEGDAISSSNIEDEGKGFIYIESGIFDLTTDADGIQAVNSIIIDGGTFTVNTLDDCLASDVDIIIGGGTFDLDAGGDAINATSYLTIYDGDITVNAEDDGIHSDFNITINGGTISVEDSYEGIEAYEIIINGGVVTVVSEDDGINCTTGGGQEHGPQYVSTGGYLEINGGIITVTSVSDGVDVNGSGVMNGGYLVVFGSSDDSQSSIDYDDSFEVNGGVVIALGSTGMIQTLSTTSDQASLMYAGTSNYSSGTTISLLDSDGDAIVTLTSVKTFAGVTLSCPDLVIGESYSLEVGDDTEEFTVSSTVTSLGDPYAGESGGMITGPGRR